MDALKWIKRKYPKSALKFIDEFGLDQIETYCKNGKYKLGVLAKKHIYVNHYEEGTLIIWRRYKDYWEGEWTGDFSMKGIVKCEEGLTSSGFHSIDIPHGGYIEEIEV